MYSSRFWLYLSLALAALFSFSSATLELDKRQADDTLGDLPEVPSAVIPVSAVAAATTTLPVINADTTTSSSSSSSDTVTKTSTTPFITPPLSNLTTTTTSTTSSTTPTSTSTSSTSESPAAITTPSIVTIPASTIVTTRTLGGSVYVSSSTSYSMSTASGTASGTAAASSDSNTSASGMTQQTRSMIIGITVGLGGAIILAGLAFVAWRLWGKRAPRMDEDEILMAGSNAHGEKLTGSSGSQFKSTLDQYHAHSGTNF